MSFYIIWIWPLLISTHGRWFPLCFLTTACQMTLCLFASTWRGTRMSAIMRVSVCEAGQSSDRWTVCSGTPPTVSGPLQWLVEESTTSRLLSPNSRITTWRTDSGCCPSWPPCQTLLPYPLTPPPISPLKVPKPPPLNVWFLFIHGVFLLPHPLTLE